MTIASALLLVLVHHVVRAKLHRRHPAFFAYLVVAIARAIEGFVGISDDWYMLNEGATTLIKALAVLEGFVLLFPRPKVPILGLLVAVAAVFTGIAWHLPTEPNAVREFERYRVALHVGMAAFTATGYGWLWLWPRPVSPYTLDYWRTWTIKLLCGAAIGLVNYQAAMTTATKWALYYVWAGGHLLPTAATYALWIRWARSYGGVPGGWLGGSSAGSGRGRGLGGFFFAMALLYQFSALRTRAPKG